LTPFKSYIPTNSQGLDFGSGPGPTLSKMFEEDGYKMDIYDIFYAKNEMVFDKIYDFITMSEVIEHIHNLDIELNRVWSILKSGGFLGIMTAFRPTDEEFANWYYKRDLTHVRFFSEKTFRYIAHTLGATIVYIDNGVVILKK
jgi:SAM-dependent methyltransferase